MVCKLSYSPIINTYAHIVISFITAIWNAKIAALIFSDLFRLIILILHFVPSQLIIIIKSKTFWIKTTNLFTAFYEIFKISSILIKSDKYFLYYCSYKLKILFKFYTYLNKILYIFINSFIFIIWYKITTRINYRLLATQHTYVHLWSNNHNCLLEC